MRKNSLGVIVSVKDISEVSDSMVQCKLCGKEFIPSLDCDAFGLSDERDDTGEMPVQCENCFDDALTSQGIGIIDMSHPDGIQIKPAKPPKT